MENVRMLKGMSGAKDNFKVVGRIVELVTVLVVNNLILANAAAKELLHDVPMSKDAFSMNVNHPVTAMVRSLSVGSFLNSERVPMLPESRVVLEAESMSTGFAIALLDDAEIRDGVGNETPGCGVLYHSVHGGSSLTNMLPQRPTEVKRNGSAKRVNSGKLLTDKAEDNPEPSQGYIPGRCNDYRRGSALLITGKNARPERDDIVYSSGKPEVERFVTATDGNAVSAAQTSDLPGTFCGILDEALADSAYGKVQVYGFRTSAWVSGSTGSETVPGCFLIPGGTAPASYMEHSTLTAATTSGWTFISLMETVTTTALAQKNVFIRGM